MPTFKNILPLFLCLLLLLSGINQAWSRSVEKQAVLTALTLNIARFTRWPEHAFGETANTLNLCVFGNNMVQQSFENIDNKVVNKKTINIINLSRLRSIEQCQLLYINELDKNRLAQLLMELDGKAILTIGENLEFLQTGGMVGLEKIDGKIQLTFNLPIIKKAKLVISSRLLKLAKIVNFPAPAH